VAEGAARVVAVGVDAAGEAKVTTVGTHVAPTRRRPSGRTSSVRSQGLALELLNSTRKLLGFAPVGVRLIFDASDGSATPPPALPSPRKPIRFCEAVGRVMPSRGTLALTAEQVSCPSARRVFGFACGGCATDRECLRELAECGRFDDDGKALAAFSQVPCLPRPPSCITLSPSDPDADVYLMYMRPDEFMLFLQGYQGQNGEELPVSLSSVMPICGNCTVRPVLTGQACISFGCKDSRRYGGLRRGQIAMGIPPTVLQTVLRRIGGESMGNRT